MNNNTVDAVTASMSVTYTTSETAGDLNVVVVGWSDTTASVTSVVDDNTNTYALVGTTAGNGVSQAIYYARNIVLPTNNTPTVTVNFNQSAAFPDVRILEYSGLSTTAPLDIWAGNSGSSTSADSGAATTTTNDLILGAGTTDAHFTAARCRIYIARDHHSVPRYRRRFQCGSVRRFLQCDGSFVGWQLGDAGGRVQHYRSHFRERARHLHYYAHHTGFRTRHRSHCSHHHRR